jgi:two-component system phosphate regulon sensor histidine kinase PhoR
MLRQVEKVLQMAQMDEKDFKLKISQINMHMVIQQAVDHLSLQVQRREGRITMHLDAEYPMIEGDHTHLSNVIYNMLDNANKYSENAPEIVISTKNVGDGIEITVADNGIGMTKEDQKHIFDKFYRVHTGNVHDVKGFGLGLSYVKAIALAHKGSIHVKSEPGKGSEFCLYLPVYFKYPK